ncbi:response regulator [bacterium]|nr:response regulator [bacterium]
MAQEGQKTYKILHIDDDIDFSSATKIILEKAGFKVVNAIDGKQGREKAQAEKPDLILLDIMLPDVEGYSLCREFKENLNTSHVPVLILSSISTKPKGKGYANLIANYHKADGFLEKPVEKEDLIARIQKLLSKEPPKPIIEPEKKTILLIDDDPDYVTAIEIMLKKNNFEVLVAEDGIEGEKLAHAFMPDLILLDVMMPGKDGYSVCYELKRHPKTHHIPVIVITSIGSELVNPEFAANISLGHGANDFMEKPVKYDQLLEKINSFLYPEG